MITKKDILELETRRNIYNYILKNPGLHFRELQRKTNIPEGTLKYHLQFLKKRELITTENTGRYQNYFIKNKVGKKEKQLLSLLNKETPCKIILYMFFRVCCNRTEISQELDKHPNTIIFHLNKLLHMGIIEPALVENGVTYGDPGKKIAIERDSIGNEILYRVKDRATIIDLLVTHKESLLNYTMVDFLFDWWDFSRLENLPKRINNFEAGIDSIFESIFEMFPHPYHS